MGPFEINKDHIQALTDRQLTELLLKLLHLEAAKLGLPKRHASVSLNITSADGGEDGRIEWESGPDPGDSDWLPTRCVLFQVKATYMGIEACKNEVLSKKTTREDDGSVKQKAELSSRVKTVAKDGGAYVLVYGRSCEGKHVTERVEKIREGFAEAEGQDTAERVHIDVYGTEKIASWTNQYAAAVAFVMEARGLQLPGEMQSWESWEEEDQSTLDYFADADRTETIDLLRETLSEPARTFRLVGLSGLGKTRLAMEAFRPPPDAAIDPGQQALSEECVYVARADNDEAAIVAAVRGMKRRGVSAILVIDECQLDLHKRLAGIVRAPGSQLRLLSLDFDPDSAPSSDRRDFHCLQPLKFDDMKALVESSGLSIPDEHIEMVARIADGFPRMAEFVGRLLEDGNQNLWELETPEVFRSLVVRRAHKPEEVWEVAKLLSVVEHIATDGDEDYQLKQLISAVLPNANHADVYRRIKELEASGIAYRRGDYVRLTPLPLAVVLAANFWAGVQRSRAVELFTGDELPEAVVNAMKSQLSRLRGHTWVEELVAKIVEIDGPFGSRDLANSATGSRLLSSLAEVNPDAVASLLSYHFGGMTPDEAKAVDEGRRHLVWCLEKLAWWPETFEQAAWILLLFAAGENETWGNNATAQFKQLFHLYLSGTETPAAARLDLIQRGLNTKDERIEAVCVDALGAAFTTGHFHRTGGVENQGLGLARRDWVPSSPDDIREYWDRAMNLLSPYLLQADERGDAAREELAKRLRGMIRSGAFRLVESAISAAHSAQVDWPEALDALRSALNYDGDNYSDELRAKVTALVETLEPSDLASRLRLIVTTPSWNELRKEEDGSVTVVAEERAEALALEIAEEPDSLVAYLPQLLEGEQHQAFRFGRTLGENVEDADPLLDGAMAALIALPAESRNPLLLMGMASGASKHSREAVHGRVLAWLSEEPTRLIALDVLRAIGPADDDAVRLVEMLESGHIDARHLRSFSFGGTTKGISDDRMAQLLEALLTADDGGAAVAMEMLFMHLHNRPLPPELLTVTKHVVLAAAASGKVGDMGGHRLEKLAQAVLKCDDDEGFVASLAQELITKSERIGVPSRHVPALLGQLLKEHVDAVWPIMLGELNSDDWSRKSRVATALGKWFGKGVDLVDIVGADRLLEWASSSQDAAYWCAKMIEPLAEEGHGHAELPSWSPFVVELIKQHGDDKDVRSAISANIGSGAWSGSAVPRLQRHHKAFKELRKLVEQPEVLKWAESAIKHLDEEIARETKRDEEREFGILR